MQQATHIYRNGIILTMDSRCSIVSCLAVSGETILAVGSEAEVAPFQGPETHIVDLGGRFMMPGFYDCHSHFMRAGMYNKYYLDVNSHPIEDILNAFEEAQKAYPRANARHIIIHCQTVREDQLDLIERLGVVPSFFTVHTYYWGDRHRDIFLGKARASRIDPLRSALKRGIPFTSHNDTSVTPMDPLLSVWSAVNRLTGSGKVLGEDQTVSVLDALKSVTIWGAYQFHEERMKGSLEPGKLADMVILGENPLEIAPERIRDIPILATLVGNRLVYGSL